MRLTGDNSVEVDLNAGGQQATAAPTAAPTEPQATQAAVSAEVGMPLTGSSGWLLAGASLLGVLVLLTAGARRVLEVQEPGRN